MSNERKRIKPIRAREESYFGWAKERPKEAERALATRGDVPKIGDFTLLSWSLTEHPLPGYEITTAVREGKDESRNS